METHADWVHRLLGSGQRPENLLAILLEQRDHLTHCAVCRAQIARLAQETLPLDEALGLALHELEVESALPAPAVYPTFDLTFLQSSRSPVLWQAQPGAVPALGPAVRRLADDIRLHVILIGKRMAAQFADLSDSLLPAPAYAFAPARGGATVPQGEVLTLPDPTGNLEIALTVQPTSAQRITLALEARYLTPSQPVERARVCLRATGGQEVAHTSAGKVAFPNLAPGHYTVEIQPNDETVWQFKLDLESR